MELQMPDKDLLINTTFYISMRKNNQDYIAIDKIMQNSFEIQKYKIWRLFIPLNYYYFAPIIDDD